MLSFLFRTRARLEADLAVERVRREFAEQDVARLRTELRDTTAEYARFRDQALARLNVIAAPVTSEAVASSRYPGVSPFAALRVTEINGERPQPFPEPAMPDA